VGKGRLEAFSDGVMAIIITIMVLELKVPHGEDLSALIPLIPVATSYLLSFVFVGIYWNNHHHTMHAVHKVNGPILWANMHLLFWLSLIPFATNWMGENSAAPWPVAMYGIILLMCAIAYTILTLTLIRYDGNESPLATAIGSDFKGKLSLFCYIAAIPLAFVNQWIAYSLYVFVALLWFIPDRRIERVLNR
jgi:uncharacterized membrane protein